MSIMYCSAVPSSLAHRSPTLSYSSLEAVQAKEKGGKTPQKDRQRSKGRTKKQYPFMLCQKWVVWMVAFHTARVCSTGLVHWINPKSLCLHPKMKGKKKQNTGVLPRLLDLLFELWQAGSLERRNSFYQTMQKQGPVKWHRLLSIVTVYCICENLHCVNKQGLND